MCAIQAAKVALKRSQPFFAVFKTARSGLTGLVSAEGRGGLRGARELHDELRVRRQLNEGGWRVGRDELAEGDENLDGSRRGRPHRALIEAGLALVEKGRAPDRAERDRGAAECVNTAGALGTLPCCLWSDDARHSGLYGFSAARAHQIRMNGSVVGIVPMVAGHVVVMTHGSRGFVSIILALVGRVPPAIEG
jgi:hypothetical protein